ncbi:MULTISPECIES: protein-ADP-ribose hydrolase [Psychrilyobacter]|uniref:Protein-ADP-ribose hydrolase n=1 Tax=Psychrilyobacter piezotolerans TaxID=2293438 RepID=A0ABX9KK00_9FUSO|nr:MULTISPECIES: protein-ADP-ribose hydrolase [Psychrilyobacter]MCS5421137.1 protein-ADP-ribose hydrolase [Psychrilyobacter sp. S5]NDI77091.1 protein-ADP-ribose hydrolase [Psychrilyobacter piezotolerans]RDE64092.1 protein-ADP-ribose hydrolase [Psychrilyobacter sp. S5]REI42184.1 protein-ADP-ribose hydrolase [Psychrilyobacter piezotolerans]
MNLIEMADYLLKNLLEEKRKYGRIAIPKDIEGKKILIRHLMNIREALPVSDDFLNVQDKYLKTINNKITDADNLKSVSIDSRLILWQGDITTLNADAIVNAANNQMLGCFIPGHRCIDNAIHSMAGIQLRLECDRLMKQQGSLEKTGTAKITRGYNLPSKYIIHTVGPIIKGKLKDHDIEDLRNCYLSCMKIADEYKLESIAFCCISTGEFRFPNEEAAETAVNTVTEYLKGSTNLKRVIFNVFKDKDNEIYKKLLR